MTGVCRIKDGFLIRHDGDCREQNENILKNLQID
jgi:hypothetical protein